MQKLDKKISSILDANFGRLSEGLRVLEDIVRFILRDFGLTKKLKEMRHSLLAESRPFDLEFLDSRGEDLGASLFAPDESKRENFIDLVIANAKRAEESLRVLEEYFKFLGPACNVVATAGRKTNRFKNHASGKSKKTIPALCPFGRQIF